MQAIILAAGRGSRMGDSTERKPKGLVELFGKPLVQYQLDAMRAAGIEPTTIVTGYKAEQYEPLADKTIRNDNWSNTNMVASLMCASSILLKEPCIVSYSDIFYPADAVEALLSTDAECAISFDPAWRAIWEGRFDNPLDDAESFRLADGSILAEIGKKATSMDDIEGQYMGLLRFTPAFWTRALEYLHSLDASALGRLDMTSFLQAQIERGEAIKAVAVDCLWGEVDSQEDLAFYETSEKYQAFQK